MSEKLKKVCMALNYIENLFILFFTSIGCLSIFGFALLLFILIGIASSATGLKLYAVTAGSKEYKSIIKKKKKRAWKLHKIVFLAKIKVDAMEVLISKALIDSNSSHDKFVSVNEMLKRDKEMKEAMRNRFLCQIIYKYGL